VTNGMHCCTETTSSWKQKRKCLKSSSFLLATVSAAATHWAVLCIVYIYRVGRRV
jgi:hypothetical protein